MDKMSKGGKGIHPEQLKMLRDEDLRNLVLLTSNLPYRDTSVKNKL